MSSTRRQALVDRGSIFQRLGRLPLPPPAAATSLGKTRKTRTDPCWAGALAVSAVDGGFVTRRRRRGPAVCRVLGHAAQRSLSGPADGRAVHRTRARGVWSAPCTAPHPDVRVPTVVRGAWVAEKSSRVL